MYILLNFLSILLHQSPMVCLIISLFLNTWAVFMVLLLYVMPLPTSLNTFFTSFLPLGYFFPSCSPKWHYLTNGYEELLILVFQLQCPQRCRTIPAFLHHWMCCFFTCGPLAPHQPFYYLLRKAGWGPQPAHHLAQASFLAASC